MAENLKTTRYNDCSTSIPYFEGLTVENHNPNVSTDAYTWYNNDISYKDSYGALYNWYAVNTGKLCPTGWHVSSDEEWITMEAYLEMPQNQLYEIGLWRGTDQGSKIKSTSGWFSNGNGTNSTGFSAVPAGLVGGWLNYGSLEMEAIFQTSTEYGPNDAVRRSLYFPLDQINRYFTWKWCMYSVRCIKDN